MLEKLPGKRVAILATNGFEESELLEPKCLLEEAGCVTFVIAPDDGEITGWKAGKWSKTIQVDETVDQVKPEEFDALLLPGGVMNPDRLRLHDPSVEFVREFVLSGKPVGAICHGPWMLVEADVVHGREVTSWPSIKTDLVNAGAKWVDREVVADEGIVTSRKPDDIPAFAEKLIEEIAEGVHQRRSAYVK